MSYIEHNEAVVSAYPIHPGIVLKEEVLPSRKLSAVKLAEMIKASRPDVTNVLNGKKAVTPWLAVRIEAAIGYPAELLLRLQSAHDLAELRRERERELHDIKEAIAA